MPPLHLCEVKDKASDADQGALAPPATSGEYWKLLKPLSN